MMEDGNKERDPERRRESDFVSPAQLDLVVERFGRQMDRAVAEIASRVDLGFVNVDKKLDDLAKETNFMDRTLATRIDSLEARITQTDARISQQDLRIEEIATRGVRTFKLLLTGLIFPSVVGIVVGVIMLVVKSS